MNTAFAPEAACPAIPVSQAAFPEPFPVGLEFNAPARGKWNIVHIGMLLPGAHQIYICARGCLRGVVLTAAEMNAMDRMSWVGLSEAELNCGGLEDAAIQGVAAILERLNRLGKLPPAVLLFPSCMHRFAAFDYALVLETLGRAFPTVRFVEAWMSPTMRKTELPEDQLLRRQLYTALDPLPPERLDPKSVNFLGNERPTLPGEMLDMLEAGGFRVRDLCLCRTWAEYREMAASSVNITYLPETFVAGRDTSVRLGQRHLHLPLSYEAEEITEGLRRLAEALGLPLPDLTQAKARADEALETARRELGDMPVSIDYIATPRPLGLARLLSEHGFNVVRVYADAFIPEEEPAFRWLQEHAPNLALCPSMHPSQRFRKLLPSRPGERARPPVLAIGQKAAFFENTPHFVNMVAGAGGHGFAGIAHLARLMVEARREPKDTKTLIQLKGLGCESCLS